MASDRTAALQAVAGIGLRAVEHYDVLNDPTGFRATADELGLKVCSVHAPALGEKQKEIFDAALVLGTDTVIVPFQDPARFASRESLSELADELNAAARAAGQVGLRFGYHNHGFELSSKVDGKPALEVLVELLDDEVLLEVDTYWAQVGGEDVPALLGRLGDRVRFLHVKDGQVEPAAPMVAVGTGVMPVHEILAAGTSVEWRIIELDECATDMVTAVRESFEFLTGGASA
jgi:sugar phosphate isomerase/epimerase